jgi:hypothetical protein
MSRRDSTNMLAPRGPRSAQLEEPIVTYPGHARFYEHGSSRWICKHGTTHWDTRRSECRACQRARNRHRMRLARATVEDRVASRDLLSHTRPTPTDAHESGPTDIDASGRRCTWCGSSIEGMRSDARYCCTTCRVEAYHERHAI